MSRAMRMGVWITLSGTAVLVLGTSRAAAGGGCHDPATTATDARGMAEASVDMKGACFWPTTLFVDPGATVTFASFDAGMVHNVGGHGWGHFEDMERGDVFRATFDDVGIYPYACSYHPGMTGAIVVGNGIGEPAGGSVSTEPSVRPEVSVQTRTGRQGAEASSIILAGAVGLALGGGIAWAFGRGRGIRQG